jgi:DNA adenine methylase
MLHSAIRKQVFIALVCNIFAVEKYSVMPKAKPFIKWVGGKGQLIEQLESLLPADFGRWNNATYIEPFVGGGAMLFYMLQAYPNIEHAIINDINHDLIVCYTVVRDNVNELIPLLQDMEARYYAQPDMDAKREMYLQVRERYNEKNLDPIENTAKFFFLNRTCFNGLYRVNRKGLFNVPCGKYKTPQICNEETLRADSELLKRVEILEGDFEQTIDFAGGQTLFYFDPPYRPLSETSNFNDYTKESFNDESQVRLKSFCDMVNAKGYKFMLSNSDCKGQKEGDGFFDALYHDYKIDRVMASRNVNANGAGRGKISEILVHNYTNTRYRRLETDFEPLQVAEPMTVYA